jgi:hypothetical protein
MIQGSFHLSRESLGVHSFSRHSRNPGDIVDYMLFVVWILDRPIFTHISNTGATHITKRPASTIQADFGPGASACSTPAEIAQDVEFV